MGLFMMSMLIYNGSELPHSDKWRHVDFLLLPGIVLHEGVDVLENQPHDHAQKEDDIYERLVSEQSHGVSNRHD
jgi:hypothetical protein